MPAATIKYTSTDYETIRQNIISLIPSLTPNWTDFNEGDIGMVIVELFCGVADMLNYYIDKRANECFLGTAKLRQSIINLTELMDYRLARTTSAQTTLRFTRTASIGRDIVIPKYTTCATAGGTSFVINAELSSLLQSNSYIDIVAYEGVLATQTFVGDGAETQTYPISRKNVSDNFLNVYVNNVLWEEDRGQALNPDNYNIYLAKTDWEGNTSIVFSSRRGNVPNNNDVIDVKYLATSGVNGNIEDTGMVTIISSTFTDSSYLTVTNTTPATGGASAEDMETARLTAPVALRALHRAVSGEDYAFFATEIAGIAKAFAEQGDATWKVVNLYVAPTDGAVLTEAKKAEILAYFENIKDPTIDINVQAHRFNNVKITMTAYLRANVSQTTMAGQIRALLTEYFSFDRQDFGGVPAIDDTTIRGVFISDLYTLCTMIPGISRIEITELKKQTGGTDESPTFGSTALSLTFDKDEIPKLNLDNLTLTLSGGIA